MRVREEEWAHQVEEVMRWWAGRRGPGAHHRLRVGVNKESGEAGGGAARAIRSAASCREDDAPFGCGTCLRDGSKSLWCGGGEADQRGEAYAAVATFGEG